MAREPGRPCRVAQTSGGGNLKLNGRVALVTGAGRRLGQAFAVALGREGMRVAVHYNNSVDGAEQTAASIRNAGGEAVLFRANLGQPDAPATLVGDVAARLGSLSVVINSAAVMERTPVGEVTAEHWDSMFALNLRAPFFICQAAAPLMKADGGAIINIADLAAFESWPSYIPHSVSKAGLVRMTSSLAKALAPAVRVNGIAPGTVLLPEGWDPSAADRLVSTTPLGRLGGPEDVVGAMLYLLKADYVTGETLIVDGGRHIRK
ncbi:MAG: SDR family oxidoreductase [Gemmatimonadales bacterium]